MVDLLHVQHRTKISDIIEQYVECQEKEGRTFFVETRVLLVELHECLRRGKNEHFSFNMF